MRLTEVFAEGFRCFGPSNALGLTLGAGVTTLVGENESGKTAIVDAIRLALGTRGDEYLRLQESDFHVSKEGRTGSLRIRCTLEELTEEEQSRFLEWCTLDAEGRLRLFVTLSVAELEFPSKSEQPARVEVASGLFSGLLIGQAAGSESGCCFRRARRALA